jgi:hypothetical protein
MHLPVKIRLSQVCVFQPYLNVLHSYHTAMDRSRLEKFFFVGRGNRVADVKLMKIEIQLFVRDSRYKVNNNLRVSGMR